MGKYKDALIKVSKDCKGYAMEWGFGKCACSKSLQLLKELVMEKELKIELEEVKKEWEKLGYTWKKVGDYHDGIEYTKYIIEKNLLILVVLIYIVKTKHIVLIDILRLLVKVIRIVKCMNSI